MFSCVYICVVGLGVICEVVVGVVLGLAGVLGDVSVSDVKCWMRNTVNKMDKSGANAMRSQGDELCSSYEVFGCGDIRYLVLVVFECLCFAF